MNSVHTRQLELMILASGTLDWIPLLSAATYARALGAKSGRAAVNDATTAIARLCEHGLVQIGSPDGHGGFNPVTDLTEARGLLERAIRLCETEGGEAWEWSLWVENTAAGDAVGTTEEAQAALRMHNTA